MEVDQARKQKYLNYYSEFIDIKYEQYGLIKQIPHYILNFSTQNTLFEIFSINNSSEKYLSTLQKNLDNIQTAWRFLFNTSNDVYLYLTALAAWFELLKRYIERQGVNKTGDEFYDKHLVLVATQEQTDIINELELSLNASIIGLCAVVDKIAHVILRTYNELFPEYNKKIIFVENNDINKVVDIKKIPDVTAGKVAEKLKNNNKNDKYTEILKHINFFLSDDFLKIRNYRDDYVHAFGQLVGCVDSHIQLVYDYVDISNKNSKECKPFLSQYSIGVIREQQWTHQDLTELTIKLWNKTIDKIELLFKNLSAEFTNK